MLERLVFTILIAITVISTYKGFLNLQKRWRKQNHPVENPVLLYFYGQHCSTCKAQAHYLSQLDVKFQELIQKINVEEDLVSAQQYRVFTLPTTILLDRMGNIQHTNYGLVNSVTLRQQIEAL